MTQDTTRAAFEAWYQHHHGDRDVYALDEFGEYADKRVQSAFNVWQARAAIEAGQECCGRFESRYGGISMRDYFAAKVCAALLTATSADDDYPNLDYQHQEGGPTVAERVATIAYRMADAMLKERETSDD